MAPKMSGFLKKLNNNNMAPQVAPVTGCVKKARVANVGSEIRQLASIAAATQQKTSASAAVLPLSPALQAASHPERNTSSARLNDDDNNTKAHSIRRRPAAPISIF
ncbi:hypothetical protein NX059_005410 [Plenodomus lindquistii]|nr:hypothetical protein NX059_005410 [Plenodomus lindquistii]